MTTTPDFEARARAIVDNWVYGELAKKDEDGLKRDISFALSLAFEEGLGCQATSTAACEPSSSLRSSSSENGGEAERERVAINGIIAALLSATKLNLPADVQELLLRGDASRAVPSGILRAMLLAAHSASPIEEAGTADEVSAANTAASLTPKGTE